MVHEVAIVGRGIGGQHAARVLLLLTAIDGLREGRRSSRVHSSIGRVIVVLIIELKI